MLGSRRRNAENAAAKITPMIAKASMPVAYPIACEQIADGLRARQTADSGSNKRWWDPLSADILANASTMSPVPTSASASAPEAAGSCAFVVGDDGLSRWSDVHADAWIGLLETHKRLTRVLDAELEARHGLGLSALELLGRLAAAEDRYMRLSALAEQTGLSLSRVSRVVDTMEERGLVERVRCESDARAVNAHLTDAGLRAVREAQATHFAGVQKLFFNELSAGELSTLAAVFARFAPRAAQACTTDD